MTKTVFRYFFDFIEGQEKWLNKMAKKGYRLKKCGKMVYVFESCRPDEYDYAVEFVADKSYVESKNYRQFLESMGFRTVTKNINLNFSFGKARWRPYAKGMGQVATSPGGFNKELLIVEKRDGKPFELHTDLEDLISNYRAFLNSYLWAAVCSIVLVAITFMPNEFNHLLLLHIFRIIIGAVGVSFIVLIIKYSSTIRRHKKESKTNE